LQQGQAGMKTGLEGSRLADEREAAVRSKNQKRQLERTVASRRQQR
jgi:hypothetical protein